MFLEGFKSCSYESTGLIISKKIKSLFESYLPFIYINYHFIFQTADSKSTLRWHCNPRRYRCIWRIDSYKGERKANNTELLFALWKEVKDIWCTCPSLVSFHLEFLNWRTQLKLPLFQDFEQNRCVYYIFYLTSWSSSGNSLLSNCLFLTWRIGIYGVKPLGIEEISRI